MNLIKDISDFIFVNDASEKADIIMIVGGTFPEPAEKAAELYKGGYADTILASGKYAEKSGRFPGSGSKAELYGGNYETESDFFKSVLMKNGVPEESIICESNSRYTYENAAEAAKLLKEKRKNVKSALLCCQAFHARRALMYYSLYFPGVKFLVAPSDTQGITKDSWFKSQPSVDVVLGELERIGTQFKDKILKF